MTLMLFFLSIIFVPSCMDYPSPKDAPNLNGRSINEYLSNRNKTQIKTPINGKDGSHNLNCEFTFNGELKVPEFGFRYDIAGAIRVAENSQKGEATLLYLTFDNKKYIICPVTSSSYFIEDTRFEFKFRTEILPAFMKEAPPGLGFDPGGNVKIDMTIKGVLKEKNSYEGNISFLFYHPLIGPFSSHLITNFTGTVKTLQLF